MKTCSSCELELPAEEFYPQRNDCKGCLRTREKERYHRKRSTGWRKPNRTPEQVRVDNLRRYGLSPESFDTLLEQQGGVCAICGVDSPEKRRKTDRHFHVDHCHKTGVVRGLLCNRCNRGLGMLGDDNLESAMQYLESAYQKEPSCQEC